MGLQNSESQKGKKLELRWIGFLIVFLAFLILLNSYGNIPNIKKVFSGKIKGEYIPYRENIIETKTEEDKMNHITMNHTGSVEAQKNISYAQKKAIIEDNNKNKIDKINILLVGRGGSGHDAPNLTDTIILASLHLQSKTISLLSIPRDLYVEYNNENSGRINRIYESYAHKFDSKQKGMEKLAEKVSEITNQNIDFFVNVDFNGFTSIIDIIGGIELTIKENFVDYQYPDGKGGYRTLVFKKGTWLFDGENALKYARSRHSTSDFDRSLRQQQILQAIKTKLNAGYLLSSPGKIKRLYDSFQKYVYTNLTFTDIIKIGIRAKIGDYDISSFNLNDSCFYGSNNCERGGLLYIPERELFGGASVLLVDGTHKSNLSDYSIAHKYTNLIFNNPGFFTENYRIKVVNSVKINFLASILADEMRKYGFHIPKENGVGNGNTVYEKSTIYFQNIGEQSYTIQALKDFYPEARFLEANTPKYSTDQEIKIEIILGKDYKKIFNLP